MRIALIASPFISVPPSRYGGTESFIAQLAEGLKKLDIDVVVYANGESRVGTEVRWLYPRSEWPIPGEIYGDLKDMNHSAWAVRDAAKHADLIHVNNVPGLAFSRFADQDFVCTIHHKHEPTISSFYEQYPDTYFVSISRFQQKHEQMPRIRTIHHGLDMKQYRLQEAKQEYLSFLGRLAPMKGVHNAIEVAKLTGIPLKIAGEVQPVYRDYFESKIKPHLDGKLIEYVGEMDIAGKNELLGNSMGLLFPIEWDEPFGLVMIEAMATGTPVLAFAGGSVEEVVGQGVSGEICANVDDMAARARELSGRYQPKQVRRYAEENFSVERMVREYAHLYSDILASPKSITSEFAEYADEDELTEEPEEPRAIA